MPSMKSLLSMIRGVKLPHPDPTGLLRWLHVHVREKYGDLRLFGHGRAASETRKGPGRRRMPPCGPGSNVNPTGTKLIKRFIRDSGGEATYWRRLYHELTGNTYGK